MINEILYWLSVFAYFIFLIILGASILFAFFTQIPFIPTKRKVTNELIRLAELKDGQTVYDLGCGDFRLLTAAEKVAKVHVIGYELAPLPFLLGWIRKFLTGSHGKILCRNFMKQDISNANTIFLYLIPDVLPKLAEKIKTECKPGTKIISNTFNVPELPLKFKQEKNKDKGLPPIYVYEL